MPRLTEADKKLLRRALCDAADWQDSLADANHREGPEAARAAKLRDGYEALHVKMFGTLSLRAQEAVRFAAMQPVSAFDLVKDTPDAV